MHYFKDLKRVRGKMHKIIYYKHEITNLSNYRNNCTTHRIVVIITFCL